MKRANMIIKKMVIMYFSDRIAFKSAALSYYLLFAMFPFIIFISMLLGVFNIQDTAFFDALSTIIPMDVIRIIADYFNYASVNAGGSLMFFGLVFTVYFVMREVSSMVYSINEIYRVEEKRGFIQHYVIVFLFSLFIMASVIVSLVLITVGKSLLTFLSEIFNISESFINIWHYGRFVIIAIVIFGMLAALYKAAPDIKVRWKYVLPGAGAALTAWLILSIGFSFYVENMGRYSTLYGSIGAVIVLLLWLYMSTMTILMGAELNHILMKESKK